MSGSYVEIVSLVNYVNYLVLKFPIGDKRIRKNSLQKGSEFLALREAL